MTYCIKCGCSVTEDTSFCAKCGASTGWGKSSTTHRDGNRKLDAYVQVHFDGDMHKALVHLLNTKDEVNLDTFVDELTTEEADFVFDRVREASIEAYGGLDNYRAELKKQRYLIELDVTEKAVAKSTVNPFKKPLLLRLALLMVCAVITGLSAPLAALLGTSTETIALIGGLLISGIALSMSELISHFRKYRWIKKRLELEHRQAEQKK